MTTVTNIDHGSVVYRHPVYEDDVLVFTAAGTVAAGTILARDSVSLKLVPYVKGGVANENGIPKAVLTVAVTAAAAGDQPVRPLIAGEVRRERLIINADGSGINIDAAVLDQLRDHNIAAISVQQTAVLDNQ